MIFGLNPIYLILIFPLSLAGLFFVFRRYKINNVFNANGLAKMRNYGFRPMLFKARHIVLLLSLLFLAIAVMRPVWGEKMQDVEAKGTDVVFTLDVSKSMKALDMGDGSTDRLTMAKAMIASFVAKHPENRYGLVIFAGDAFVSTPLTLDSSAYLTFLDGVDYKDVSKQGTDIGAALKASIDRFSSKEEKQRGRSIVIISDGGDEMKADVSGFAKVAKEAGIKVFAVGIGSSKGVPIPESADPFGQVTYKKYNGETVLTKLNAEPLKKIASETDGEYFAAEKKGDLEKIAGKLEKMQATTIGIKANAGKADHYQSFLFMALWLMLLYNIFPLLNNLDKRIWEKIKKQLLHFKFFIFIFLILGLTGCSNSDIAFRYHNSQGNDNYNKQYLEDAIKEYAQAAESSKENKYIAENNSGVASYAKEDYSSALKKLEMAANVYCEKDKNKYCDALYYNLGNAYYRIGESKKDKEQSETWQKAIEAYKNDLAINPDDKDAQENIDFIEKKSKQQEQNKQADKDGQSDKQQGGKDQKPGSEKDGSGGSQSDKNGNKGDESKDGSQENKKGSQGEQGKQDSANGGQGQKGQEDKNGSANGGQGNGTADNKDQNAGAQENNKLDENTDKQVEEYMQNLDNQSKNNQGYFQPNPNGSYDKGSPFDDFFSNNPMMNDPFFKNFMRNTPMGNQFGNGQQDTNGVDW